MYHTRTKLWKTAGATLTCWDPKRKHQQNPGKIRKSAAVKSFQPPSRREFGIWSRPYLRPGHRATGEVPQLKDDNHNIQQITVINGTNLKWL